MPLALLQAIPPQFARLRKIQRLDFANNMIKRVPSVLGHLRGLKELNLRYNNLERAFQAAADEGLSKFLAFLRQEEEREQAEARERSRPIGTQARCLSALTFTTECNNVVDCFERGMHRSRCTLLGKRTA